jgi:hypothetical protein
VPPDAVALIGVLLGLHVAAVVVAFGALFAVPVVIGVAERADRRAVPAAHRARVWIGRLIVNPGLTVVIGAGVALAFEEHRWGAFFVHWGLAAAIVLGGIEGGYAIPRSRRLGALATRDLRDGGAAWSDEYLRLRRRLAAAGWTEAVLVLATVFVMAVKPSA